jgi:hypothetical protein
MKTVDELISEWTEEEKRKLGDLIEECREREKKILLSREASKAIGAKIKEMLEGMASELLELQRRIEDFVWLVFSRPGGLIN